MFPQATPLLTVSQAGGGGGTPWTPSNLSSKVAWWRPDTGITYQISPSVQTLAPKEGSGTLTQAGNYPQYMATGLGGLPALDGPSMGVAYSNTTRLASVAWVGKMNNLNAAYGRMISLHNSAASADWNNTQGFNVARDNLTTNLRMSYNSIDSTDVNVGYGTAFIAVVVADGTNLSLYINGSLTGTIALHPTDNFNINRFRYGQVASTGNTAGNPTMADLVLMNGAMTTDERQRFEGYAAHRYGLTSVLPVGHPYKSTPPTV